MRIAVIGAGPAGLTAAYQLLKNQKNEVDIFESSETVGGLSKSVSAWGFKLDLGPHRFFTKDPEVMALWREFSDDKYQTIARQTRILYGNKLYNYPLKPFDALSKLGPLEAFFCVASYLKAQVRGHREGESFQEWAQKRFGHRLFNTFFKSYTEKLWGIPCADLDSEFGKQRIQQFSLAQAIFTALGWRGRHRTLVDEFPYPEGGTGELWEKVSEKTQELGGKLYLNSQVQEIQRQGSQIAIRSSGEMVRQYDHVISTMPLTHLIKALPGVPSSIRRNSEALTFRNTILVYLLVDSCPLFPDQWLYINSKELKCGRITNFNNWSPSIVGDTQKTVLCLEYWAQGEDEIWNQPETEIAKIALDEIRLLPILQGIECLDSRVLRIRNSYPIYKCNYKAHLNPVIDYLKSAWPDISPIGRYGSFKYNNQDHSIKMGILAADRLNTGNSRDLWSVNNNTSYQENSLIIRLN